VIGTTFQVAGVVRSEVKIHDAGRHSTLTMPGVGQATGDTLKNPISGEDNNVDIELETGFIWKRGQCGQGTFKVEAEGIELQYQNTSWIRYDFDWGN